MLIFQKSGLGNLSSCSISRIFGEDSPFLLQGSLFWFFYSRPVFFSIRLHYNPNREGTLRCVSCFHRDFSEYLSKFWTSSPVHWNTGDADPFLRLYEQDKRDEYVSIGDEVDNDTGYCKFLAE